MAAGRCAGSDKQLTSKTALRMYCEGRFREWEEFSRSCRGRGLVGGAIKREADRLFPPLSPEELAQRRAEGLAPSEEDVALLVERQVKSRSKVARSDAGDSGGKKGSSAPLTQYARSRFRGGQQATASQEVEWVKNNLAVKDVRPKDAPSPGAWAMLEAYRATAGGTQIFFEKIYSAMLPRRQEIEAQERFKDDGRKLDDMADGVAKLAEAAVERAKEQWARLEAQAGGASNA